MATKTFVRNAGAGVGGAGQVDDIGTSTDAKEYSSFASDIDLVAAGPGAMSGPCRGIMVTATAGNLQIVTAAGVTQTFDCTNLIGVFLPIAARTIKGTTTTVGKLIVFW